MHATGAAHTQSQAAAAATFITATVAVAVAVLVASCCRTPHKWLLGLRTMDCNSDCDSDSECNRFWAGRGSLLTYIGRIAHRLQPLPAHHTLPPLPAVQKLDKSLCAWKFQPSRASGKLRAALNRLLDMEKLNRSTSGRGRAGRQAGQKWFKLKWLHLIGG